MKIILLLTVALTLSGCCDFSASVGPCVAIREEEERRLRESATPASPDTETAATETASTGPAVSDCRSHPGRCAALALAALVLIAVASEGGGQGSGYVIPGE